jgi:hypothetical protein
MTDPLQLEGGVGQRSAFPANLQPAVRELIDFDYFAAKANRNAFRFEHQLRSAVVYHELVGDLPLLTPTQNLIEILLGRSTTAGLGCDLPVMNALTERKTF